MQTGQLDDDVVAIDPSPFPRALLLVRRRSVAPASSASSVKLSRCSRTPHGNYLSLRKYIDHSEAIGQAVYGDALLRSNAISFEREVLYTDNRMQSHHLHQPAPLDVPFSRSLSHARPL